MSEGKRILEPIKGRLADTLIEMEQDVQSSISYAGGRKLMDIRKVNYVILGGENAGEHLAFSRGAHFCLGAALARAFRSASDAAYRAVRRPVEGTMLSISFGRSMPLLSARPSFSDHLYILSTPSMLPTV